MIKHDLIFIPLEGIFLEGCNFEIQISHQQEHLKITLDGGYLGAETIVYFALSFKQVGCVYYENNEMWTEQLDEKYHLAEIEAQGYRGVFRCDTSDHEKINAFDPRNRLNLTRFLVLGQHCYCEFIANKEFSIQTLRED